ncbi:hypothetical protein KCP73_05845 [Salmonella enterica subsp. enterica]|nr:hypothetical protein KCP73_05845 [Salmonella enterica subsp. enterica]
MEKKRCGNRLTITEEVGGAAWRYAYLMMAVEEVIEMRGLSSDLLSAVTGDDPLDMRRAI